MKYCALLLTVKNVVQELPPRIGLPSDKAGYRISLHIKARAGTLGIALISIRPVRGVISHDLNCVNRALPAPKGYTHSR